MRCYDVPSWDRPWALACKKQAKKNSEDEKREVNSQLHRARTSANGYP